MDELLTAIFTRYKAAAGAALRAITTGGMFQGSAESDAAPPYIVLGVVSNSETDTLESSHERPLVDFTVYDNAPSPLRAWSANRAIKTLYADQYLTLSSWSTVIAQVEQPGIQLWDSVDKFWTVVLSMRYQIGQ